MGQKRWEKILRFAVCLALAALLLIYIAPKSVLAARLAPGRLT